MDKIQVYVGAAPNGEDAESMMVLEHSLRKHTTGPVEIHWMQLSRDRSSPWYSDGVGGGWVTTEWPTPFSGFRWAIPWAAGYEGRAIYMDSDMIIRRDLRELWEIPFDSSHIVAAKSLDRFCVCVWDCNKFKTLVDRGRMPDPAVMRSVANYHNRMKSFFYMNPHVVKIFDTDWNNLDGEDRPLSDAKILHYTDMRSQPHLPLATKRLSEIGATHWFDEQWRPHWREDVRDLFMSEYNEALQNGFRVENYVPAIPFGDYKKLSQKGYRANHGFDPE